MMRIVISRNSGYGVFHLGVFAFWCLGGLLGSCVAAEELLRSETLAATVEDAEFQIQLRASAQETSWEEKGRECALLKIKINGRYDQHVFLFGGALETDYEFIVGPLEQGEHSLQIYWDRSWAPELVERPNLRSIKTILLDRARDEPVLRAPILYLRKDTLRRFSDVPLVLYRELEDAGNGSSRLTYSVIFSNEDGGTNTQRLMSRWGRTTDIEWCYSYSRSGAGVVEEYQGANHQTLPFRGRKEGRHPILFDVTPNNNFADALEDPPECRVRMAPAEARLDGKARESVMDRFSWTYALMAQELIREEKLEYPPDPLSPGVSDLRNYVYLEACSEQRGTEIYFAIQIKGNSRWFRSDHGDPKSGIERSGCARSTVELPPGTRPMDLRALRIHSRPAPVPDGQRPVSSPVAEIRTLSRLFFLEEDYRPGPNLLERKLDRKLKPGQSVTLFMEIR